MVRPVAILRSTRYFCLRLVLAAMRAGILPSMECADLLQLNVSCATHTVVVNIVHGEVLILHRAGDDITRTLCWRTLQTHQQSCPDSYWYTLLQKQATINIRLKVRIRRPLKIRGHVCLAHLLMLYQVYILYAGNFNMPTSYQ